MVISLLIGSLIGVILALPPGPVGITAIKYGLFHEKKSGYQLAFGNALLDFFFCLFAIFATSAFTQLLSSISTDYPILTIAIQVSIVFGFIIFGLVNLKKKEELNLSNYSPESKTILSRFVSRGPLFFGLALALTNLANPTFMPTIAWITFKVHDWNWVQNTIASNFAFALGFGLGNFVWIASLAHFTGKFKDKFSDQFIMRIRQFAGLTFLGFGTLLGFRIFSITKWSEVLRLIFAF